MDLISIIIPVYKVEEYIEHCIESVINQTYPKIEIILVDDGSPDRCPQICDEWSKQDNRIKVIHKENGGLSDARNIGMTVAQGKYIAFVDSDDWVDKEYISMLYYAAQNTGSDIAACNIRIVYDENSIEKSASQANVRCYSPKEALKTILQGEGFRAVAWNKLYKRELIMNESFEVGRLHEDEFFTYRIVDKAGKLAFVDAKLYNYRQRNGSIMSAFSIRHLDALVAYAIRLELLEKKYPDLAVQERRNFCVACINYYEESQALSKQEFRSAQQIIKKCRRKVRIRIKDFIKYNAKDWAFMVFSEPALIGCFSRIRHTWRKR